DRDRLRRRVEYDIERGSAALGRAEHVGQEAPVGENPIRFAHLLPLRREPENVKGAIGLAPGEPALRSQLCKLPAQRGELPNELGQVFAVATEARPFHPADLVVLAIGVVVAVLTVAYLIAGEQKRDALRQHQAREKTPAQALP